MSNARVIILTSLAMLAFAGNSLLCRVALDRTMIDPASFTAIRLASGAAMLWLVASVRGGARIGRGNWMSGLALFVYAAGFSFAYVHLTAATGALLLFGAVQITMIGHGVWSGERLHVLQVGGVVLACAGLITVLLPGLSAPPLGDAALMLAAGVAWGIYSLRGKGAGDPTCVTAGNFLRAVPIALMLAFWMSKELSLDGPGVCYAIASGALASGVGYAIWYAALPTLRATTAATVQLSVPVLAAVGGVVVLAEPLALRLGVASVAVFAGISLVILRRPGLETQVETSA